MNFRTDLAVELKTDVKKKTGGVSAKEEKKGDIVINTIEIENEIGEKIIGKPKGKYITFSVPSLSDGLSVNEKCARIIAKRLAALLPKGLILVVGLGNAELTPDALGPATASKILATRHIENELGRVEGLEGLNPVAVISPGVLGKTGMETLEIIKGVASAVKPQAVIAVDAFASRALTRLGTTVQISTAGICPGSGVGNSRKQLNSGTLGIPVISLGVPTVVDASTLALDLAGEAAAYAVTPEGREMYVTPREIDLLVSGAAELLSLSINMALQPEYSCAELKSLCSY